MNKTQLAERIAGKTNISDITILRILDVLETVVTEELRNGNEVLITGFVKFEPVDQAAMTKRNPKTGDPVDVPAKRIVKIRPMATLKRDVAGS